ncbi:ABC transporter permease [Burkholderia diffusa]|uniref:ABC transporter permease n=1 Tax=Burkholderia diffusa TaxID=488732 RepID=UPI000B082128|nr:ABC transporter permease [Burkholderia diffusa]
MALTYMRCSVTFAIMTSLGLAISVAIMSVTLSLSTLGLETTQSFVGDMGFDVIQIGFTLTSPQDVSLPLQAPVLQALQQNVHGAMDAVAFDQAALVLEDGRYRGAIQVLGGGEEAARWLLGTASAQRLLGMGASPLGLLDSDCVPADGGRAVRLNGTAVRVVGHFLAKGPMVQAVGRGQTVAFVPAAVLKSMARDQGVRHLVQVRLQNSSFETAQLAMSDVRKFFRSRYPELAIQVSSPWESIQETKALVDTINQMTLWVGFIIAVLSCIAMSNAILMSVRQRRTEIGIRLAIGALPSDIAWQLVFEAIMMAALGIGVGWMVSLIGTYAWCAWASWVWKPVSQAFESTAALGMVSAICASLWPAREAARIDPVETLRA